MWQSVEKVQSLWIYLQGSVWTIVFPNQQNFSAVAFWKNHKDSSLHCVWTLWQLDKTFQKAVTVCEHSLWQWYSALHIIASLALSLTDVSHGERTDGRLFSTLRATCIASLSTVGKSRPLWESMNMWRMVCTCVKLYVFSVSMPIHSSPGVFMQRVWSRKIQKSCFFGSKLPLWLFSVFSYFICPTTFQQWSVSRKVTKVLKHK